MLVRTAWLAGGAILARQLTVAAVQDGLLRVNLAFCTKTQAAWLEVAGEFGAEGQPVSDSTHSI